MAIKVALDLHDWTPINNRFDLLLQLKEHFPNFKVSLFAIPLDKKLDYGPYLIRQSLLEEAKKHLDWIQLIPHGLKHESSREMYGMLHEEFKHQILPDIKDAFWRDDLPYEKGFCAPHWRWSKGVVDALNEAGWWGAVLREEKELIPKRFYRYTHLLNEPFWESKEEVLKLHGHVYGTKNDIGLCMQNLLKLPRDTEWCYVTDFLEDRK
jgi:hypothetical protein